jgi:catechol 2,3-dioxygenase-like lactoylglutathione lyase family enzyme
VKTRAGLLVLSLGAAIAPFARTQQSTQLPPPGFHHVHLNSVNPEGAIGFYTQQFPSATKTTFAGLPAIRARNVYVLFTRVSAPPRLEPQTAMWHFGFHVLDVRKNLETYRQRKEVRLLPLFTTEEGGAVFVSSDTWPGTGGVLGLTRAQLAEAKAKGVKPAGGAGFAYMQGPDGVIVEYIGNMPAERINHVHMFQEDPLCAQLWYRKHLNANPGTGNAAPTDRNESNCKVPKGERTWPGLEKEGTIRVPTSGVLFDDVAVNWYANQGNRPLASSRGHVLDHFALSVTNLDAWVAKLRAGGVTILLEPYKLGDTRAAIIEGPSREAVELVEVK